MNLTAFVITRVVTHEVVRPTQMADRPPLISSELVALDERGQALLGKRLVANLASGSHCVDVTVEDSSLGSPFDHITAMMAYGDPEFITASQHLAKALTSAQTAGSIKAGSAIFAQGACNVDNVPVRFMAIIKADSDQGLFKEIRGEQITLKFVNDLILGESQRLVKIAFFIERSAMDDGVHDRPRHTSDFVIKVFDHMLQNSGDRAASAYFYSAFLKCVLADNAPRKTKHFFETAKSIIDEMTISQSEKVGLKGDLISYMRSNASTIEPRAFATEFLPREAQQGFVSKCRAAGIVDAISKDTSLVSHRLRRQSLKFSSEVVLYAKPEVLRDSVRIDGLPVDGWTNLKIRGSIESMP